MIAEASSALLTVLTQSHWLRNQRQRWPEGHGTRRRLSIGCHPRCRWSRSTLASADPHGKPAQRPGTEPDGPRAVPERILAPPESGTAGCSTKRAQP